MLARIDIHCSVNYNRKELFSSKNMGKGHMDGTSNPNSIQWLWLLAKQHEPAG